MSTCMRRGGRGGPMSTSMRRHTRRKKGLPNWRIVRYADDFVILVHGTEDRRARPARGRSPQCSPRWVFGCRQPRPRCGTSVTGSTSSGSTSSGNAKREPNKWHVYTFIADRPVQALKAKLRALTHRTSLADLGATLTRLNQITARLVDLLPACRGHAHVQTSAPVPLVADRALAEDPAPLAVDRRPHDISPTTPAGGSRSAPTGSCCSTSRRYGITRYRYRGAAIPNPWTEATATAGTVESPLRREAHGGFGERPGETEQQQRRHRAPGRLSVRREALTIRAEVRDHRHRPCRSKAVKLRAA